MGEVDDSGKGVQNLVAGVDDVQGEEPVDGQEANRLAGEKVDKERRTAQVKEQKTKEKDDPWKKAARGGPSEEWQPQAWSGGAAAAPRRR